MNHVRLASLILVGLAVVAVEARPAERAGGTISGTVTNAGSAQPVSGVTVRFMSSTGTSLGTAVTNGSGAYISGELPTGSYLVRAEPVLATGLVWQAYNGHICPAGGCLLGTTAPVSVIEPNATTNIDFALTSGGTISGTVTNAATLAAVANASMSIVSPSGVVVQTTTTNGSGQYSSGALPAGSYFVIAGQTPTGAVGQLYDGIPCPAGICAATSGTPVTVTTSNNTTINFALPAGGTISGTVTNAQTLAAVQGVTVAIFNPGGTFITSIMTNASGQYFSTGLATGTYYVRAAPTAASGLMAEAYNDVACVNNTCNVTHGAPVSVTAPNNTPGINIALTPGARISGTVTNANTLAAVAGVSVVFFNSSGVNVGGTTTDAGGLYTSPALPTGSYTVRALPTIAAQLIGELYNDIPCAGGNCTVAAGTPVAITAPVTTPNINFALQPGGNINGIVADATTGAPVPGATVTVNAPSGATVASLTTDAAGAYMTTGLATGNYYIRVVPPAASGLLSQLHDEIPCPFGTCGVNIGTPVAVTAPGATQVNFALSRGATLRGRVTDASSGEPQGNVAIGVFSEAGVLLTTVTSDAQGFYRSPIVGSGPYRVRALPPNTSNLVGELHNNLPCAYGSCVVTDGAPVVLTAPSVTVVDFALEAGATISGTVTQTVGGAPVVGATVQFFTLGVPSSGSVITDSQGAYRSPGLSNGSYFVRVTPPAGSTLIGELHNNIACPGGTCTPNQGTPVAVSVPGNTVVNFTLDAGATISGTVTNASSGLPVVGVAVQFSVGGIFGVGSATTDSLGNYVSPGLPTGSYRVRAVPLAATGLIAQVYNNVPCPGSSCHGLTGSALDVTAAGNTTINFALQPGATLTGTVTNASTGLPVIGATVGIFSNSGLSIGSVSTDNAGRYVSTAVPTGQYFVRVLPGSGLIGRLYDGVHCPAGACTVTKGTPVNLTSPNQTVLDFPMQPGGIIAGLVRRSGTLAPVTNAGVSIYDSTGAVITTVTANSIGLFISPALPTGSYYLQANAPGTAGLIGEAYGNVQCLPNSCSGTTGTAVVVTAPNLTPNIDFVLDPGGTIEGVVTHAMSGLPVAGVNVSFYDGNENAIGTTTTDLQGAYRSVGLPPGEYYVLANPSAVSGLVGQLHNGLSCPGGGCIASTGTPVPVNGNTANVNFALSSGGTITGLVTRASTGEALSNVTVAFFSASTGFELDTVTTNPSGVYVSRGLPPGFYYVKAVVSAQSGMTTQLYDNVPCPGSFCALSLGTQVEVVGIGQTPGINFVLQNTPAGTNDTYANATVINTIPSQIMADVSGAVAGAEDPAMSCGNGSTPGSVWFTYTPSQTGPVSFNTFNSNYDTVLAVYTGAPGSFVEVGCNDDSGGPTSSLIVPGVADQMLSIMVTAIGGPGFLVLNNLSVPGPPTNVTAVAGYGKATVSFAIPLNRGGGELTTATVTASPGGAFVTGESTTLVVPGLTAGVTYTFTVTVANGVGSSVPSSPSNPVTPAARPSLVYLDSGDAGDAFLYNETTGDWSRRTSQPGGGFAEESSGTWATGWSVQRADFNGDDLTDFFLFNTTTGEWAKMLNDGTGFTTQATGGWWPGWQRFSIELDGDGITDFFLYDPATGVWFKCISTPAGFTYSQGGWNPDWEIYPMRLNSDAFGDMFLISRTTGRWFWVLGQNGPDFTYPVTETWFPGWQFYPGDFNGDGLGDILLHDPPTGTYFVATSTGVGFTYVQGGWSLGWNPYVMDFNADLKDDLFLHDPATGVWFQMVSDGAGNFVNAGGEVWSLGWDILPTDVNGDGRGDIVLYNSTTGVWYQARNVVSGTFTYASGTWPTGYTVVTRAPVR